MDTIFAPLTLKGKCSICVFRISGEKVEECIKKLGVTKKLKHRFSTLSYIKDIDGNVLDNALLVYNKAPKSFTGEDVLEISIHCSNYIITKLIELLLSIKSVRFAKNGEFSKRAFLNGKIDLTQAESILDLVNSETELQHKLAINQLSGKNFHFYSSLRENIIEILSFLEAYIDFPEEDIESDLIVEINNKLKTIKEEIIKNLDDRKIGEKIKDGFKIAIIGEPNSGKSTLLNYLSKRDIAIVSNVAGTTRDVIEVSLDVNGIPIILYDTAGIRETTDIIEKEGVKRAIEKAKKSDIKILVIDSSNININQEIINLIDENTIILVNKIDIKDINTNNIKFNKLDTSNVIKISLKNQTNLDTFIKLLQKKLETIISPNINTVITNERYRNELIKSLEYINQFSFDNPIEINAENIRCSAECIGRITGKINSEEILDNIFSKFCIGK